MRPPAWCAKYVVIPFKEKGRTLAGVDCWGLAILVLRDEFGILDVPDYLEKYETTTDKHRISLAFESGLAQGWYQLPKAAAGAVIVLRLAGRPWHCAIAVNEEWMLHAVDGTNVCLERIDSLTWKDRIEGFYRHA